MSVAVDEVPVGQAAKLAGVPTAVLKDLCDARKVPARQGDRGHWYLKTSDIPSRAWIVDAVREQYHADVTDAQEAMGRFMREVEAVTFDLNEAAEDPTGLGRLGNDLRAAGAWDGPFHHALRSLTHSFLVLELTQRSLRALAEHPPTDGVARP